MSQSDVDLLHQVVKDSRYIALISQPGSTPHDLFDDYQEELHDKYNQARDTTNLYKYQQSMMQARKQMDRMKRVIRLGMHSPT